MGTETMWVDPARCTGCGLCVEVCPTGAMTMVGGQAQVDREACVGCGACVDECPVDAIHPVIQGELIPTPEPPVPTAYRPGPLTETAGMAVAAASMGLLAKTAGALVRAVGRWLARRPAATRPSAGLAQTARGGVGGGRRTRHRWRGG